MEGCRIGAAKDETIDDNGETWEAKSLFLCEERLPQ